MSDLIVSSPPRFFMRSALPPVRAMGIMVRTTTWANRVFRAEKRYSGDTENRNQAVHDVMKRWSNEMLDWMGVEAEIIYPKGGPPVSDPALFVGNHISYIDIPLLMSAAPVVFMAKKQLASWPVFGRGMRSVGTVFVDRDSKKSRADAGALIAPSIRDRKQSVALFPSGTTTLDEARPWRWGGFSIAQRYRLPIRPFRLIYEPLRKAAFIGEDAFPIHLWSLLREKTIKARLELAEPFLVTDAEKECQQWWQWSQEWFKK